MGASLPETSALRKPRCREASRSSLNRYAMTAPTGPGKIFQEVLLMRHSIPKWALCLTVAISYLYAQATGRLGGVVEDTSGAAVSGAAVVCRNLETGLVHQTLSTDAGVFHFPDLPI